MSGVAVFVKVNFVFNMINAYGVFFILVFVIFVPYSWDCFQ